ncbi:cell wall-binding repeat-containing protein [Caloramator sp. mosi_1]|uniref:cell wall-binding repeat-containing protein n=1 Tax=Caloramator sp. mosi_1 TaxID=3023090 RepID=UPI00235E4471|nr:cell wall-binding repeat-containing protein [Caloramator sp. mosi_1]WDC84967.1 cell wall-binding repeat-containing protein [Caloramator sp. mosi_1]
MNRKASKVICSAIITFTMLLGSSGVKANSNDFKFTIQEVVRLSGQDRFQTAVKVSQQGWKNGSEVVILSRGDDFPDALCASTLSKKYDAPILLTQKIR